MEIGNPAVGAMLGVVTAALLAAAGAVPTPALAANATMSPADMEKARAYIEDSEKQWVASVVSGDVSALQRIIADDVVDVDSQGRYLDKTTMLAEIHEAPKYFSSNVLDGVKVRFFGDVAVAQGSETWEGKNGLPPKGQFFFTDTWVLRDGKWQVGPPKPSSHRSLRSSGPGPSVDAGLFRRFGQFVVDPGHDLPLAVAQHPGVRPHEAALLGHLGPALPAFAALGNGGLPVELDRHAVEAIGNSCGAPRMSSTMVFLSNGLPSGPTPVKSSANVFSTIPASPLVTASTHLRSDSSMIRCAISGAAWGSTASEGGVRAATARIPKTPHAAARTNVVAEIFTA